MTVQSPPSMRLGIKAKWLMFSCLVLKFRMILVGLERSCLGCPIQSLEPPRDVRLSLFRDGGPQPTKHEAWNQGEVVETRLLVLYSLSRFSLYDIDGKATCRLVFKAKARLIRGLSGSRDPSLIVHVSDAFRRCATRVMEARFSRKFLKHFLL